MRPIKDFNLSKVTYFYEVSSLCNPRDSDTVTATTRLHLGYSGYPKHEYVVRTHHDFEDWHTARCRMLTTADRLMAMTFCLAGHKDFSNRILEASALITYLTFRQSVDRLWPDCYTPPPEVQKALAEMANNLPKEVATHFSNLYNFPSFYTELPHGTRT